MEAPDSFPEAPELFPAVRRLKSVAQASAIPSFHGCAMATLTLPLDIGKGTIILGPKQKAGAPPILVWPAPEVVDGYSLSLTGSVDS